MFLPNSITSKQAQTAAAFGLFQYLHIGRNLLLAVAVLACLPKGAIRGDDASERPDSPLVRLDRVLPSRGADFADFDLAMLQRAADEVIAWSASLADFSDARDKFDLLRSAELLAHMVEQLDDLTNQLVEIRQELPIVVEQTHRQDIVVDFLRASQMLTDLSGRVRSLSLSALQVVAFEGSIDPQMRRELIQLAREYESSLGAQVLAVDLFDPPNDIGLEIQPASLDDKLRILDLIGRSGTLDVLLDLAAFVRTESTPAVLLIKAAETIRSLGLPQDPLPGQDESLPPPEITAAELLKILNQIDAAALEPAGRDQLAELLDWLNSRVRRGVTEPMFRHGGFDIAPGDWLLMRNPSPYNLFTNLSPGLFTHVGVVTTQTGTDGIRRFVLVDLPERGDRIPATNFDTFVKRALHFVVLRHNDPKVRQAMADRAAEAIGCESQFDLNFRGGRVASLAGQSLAGKKIHTYCAGLLLLCAQETGLPNRHFFPFQEQAAEGNMSENLAKLGLSIGDDFASPTGSLFSPAMEIVARREPMHDPKREIEQAVFDAFAQGMREKELGPSHTWFQSLRLSLAHASRINPLLANALAEAADVNQDTDLVSAAKAAAVVETLDKIAYGASDEFIAAFDAIARDDSLAPQGAEPVADDDGHASRYRDRHDGLYQAWLRQGISPSDLRRQLVRYYIEQGQRQIDERFFAN